MRSLAILAIEVLQIYTYVLIAGVVLSWLVAFDVINRYNQFVGTVMRVIDALTEPVLRIFRSFLPNLGGIDISPVIVLLLIVFLQNLLAEFLL